ncbi:L-lactate dehydrogenase complex protein LldE [Sinomicrobium oceani]|uniref:L-lactate dehydrogenase complex protein LldE n=1 Tax=Sinomicrobium oceani TaxID=1150368 RepID=A0A1K1QCI2_9FLAO|nr:(Fe-S)-binding protein [Sinomicrobium oceani]SFW57437.1 L-lactate dehydrogenase complex protein LldE [Sinomicrobium oceani]
MTVGLFVPCYIDQLYPKVGRDTLEVLEKAGCKVVFLQDPLCCGQPMANSGYESKTRDFEKPFLKVLPEVDYLVTPSASCSYHLSHHLLKPFVAAEELAKVKELTEFLHDIIGPDKIHASFPYRVGLHLSCHGLRGLNLGTPSELKVPYYSKIEKVLAAVDGLDLVVPSKADECCGFGGSFAVFESAVSVKMGCDKMKTMSGAEVSYVAATDMSCLMHLEGVFRAEESTMKVMHIAEILNAGA